MLGRRPFPHLIPVELRTRSTCCAVLLSLCGSLVTESAHGAEAQPEERSNDEASDANLQSPSTGENEANAQPDASSDQVPPSAEFEETPPEASAEQPKAETPPDQPPESDEGSTEPKASSSSPPPELSGGAPEPETQPEQQGSMEKKDLVARPATTSKSPPPLPPPSAPNTLAAEVAGPVEVDRRYQMPGNIVARPLTLPEGTFTLSFSQGLVFIEERSSGSSPAFALGINEAIELGIDGGLIYSSELDDWIGLQPQPHLTLTILQNQAFELGTKLSGIISTTSDMQSSISLGVPLLFRLDSTWRLDAAIFAELGFQEKVEVSLQVPLLARAQLSPALYAGLGATAELGPTSGRKTGADAQLILGTTYQNRGVAHFDFEVDFFLENLGAGEGDRLGDGGGLFFRARFFPELY